MATKLPLYLGAEIINGKRKRKYENFTEETEDEADYLALGFKLNKKRKKNPKNLTFKEALSEYITDHKNTLSPSTIRGYKTIERNTIEFIKDVMLNKGY